MSFLLPLAILSLSAVAAPVPGSASPSSLANTGIPAVSFGAHPDSGTLYEPARDQKLSLVSSTSTTDSLTGTGLDTALWSTLQGLGTLDPAPDSYPGTWVSIGDLVDSLGADALSPVIPATGLTIQAGEDPEAWVLVPECETSSQTIADLESSSWVLLNDLVCDLTEDTFVSIQSILIHQPDESSNAAVYVCLTDLNPALGSLSLDHTLDSFLYTDIVGATPDLGLGNDLDTAAPPENLSSDPFVNASTQVGSEAGLLAPCDDLKLDASAFADGTSHVSTSTSSSLDLCTGLVDSLLDPPIDVDIASDAVSTSSSELGTSPCPCEANGN